MKFNFKKVLTGRWFHPERLWGNWSVQFIIFNLLLLSSFTFYPSNASSEEIQLKLLEGNVYYLSTTKMMGFLSKKVKGVNSELSADVALKEDCSLTGKLTIKVSGFHSGNETRDKHVFEILKGDKYPLIIFEITGVSEDDIGKVFEKAGVDKLKVQDMQIKIVRR